ncbi:osmotically inducible protein OsmC [Polaribacter sp. BM10]|uniref:OsmC family protein n=1 Tax=Polaribacter sp. BM10 TaxID=1529069 RepID=UPI00098B67C3|nr:OsmC family protein [Polaribacter sp. BM10]AQS92645.1 osmotically inducible protein OsmC [Polaribacter sp. BM10]
MTNSKVTLSNKNYLAEAKARNHFLTLDEPVVDGGDDNGPTPVEYLLTAIGGCVAMTLRMYSERKGWDLGEIDVKVTQVIENNEKSLTEEISFEKEITEDQKKRLLVIAGKCPVAKMVKGETRIDSKII